MKLVDFMSRSSQSINLFFICFREGYITRAWGGRGNYQEARQPESPRDKPEQFHPEILALAMNWLKKTDNARVMETGGSFSIVNIL